MRKDCPLWQNEGRGAIGFGPPASVVPLGKPVSAAYISSAYIGKLARGDLISKLLGRTLFMTVKIIQGIGK